MPYKNAEDKRKWEREHREERNARRRMQQRPMEVPPKAPKPSPDPAYVAKQAILLARVREKAPAPAAKHTPASGWDLLVLLVGFGLMLLAAWGGARVPHPGNPGSVR